MVFYSLFSLSLSFLFFTLCGVWPWFFSCAHFCKEEINFSELLGGSLVQGSFSNFTKLPVSFHAVKRSGSLISNVLALINMSPLLSGSSVSFPSFIPSRFNSDSSFSSVSSWKEDPAGQFQDAPSPLNHLTWCLLHFHAVGGGKTLPASATVLKRDLYASQWIPTGYLGGAHVLRHDKHPVSSLC